MEVPGDRMALKRRESYKATVSGCSTGMPTRSLLCLEAKDATIREATLVPLTRFSNQVFMSYSLDQLSPTC